MAELAAWAIIPARGGSKGIAGKNLQKIAGRSLLARAIEAARGAAEVGRCFVSTDDLQIATEARDHGAEVIARPPLLSDDAARSEDALLHALDTLEASGEKLPELLVFLQCTSPFISAADIDGTIQALSAAGSDTAHSVTGFHGFLWHDGPDGAQAFGHAFATRPRRQDRQPEYLETGAVYVMRLAPFRTARHRFFGRAALFEVPRLRSMEIDDPQDLLLARALAPYADPSARAALIPHPLGGIAFDFDGVLTDNRVSTDADGRESVSSSRADGLGIEMLRQAGIAMIVLSKERNPVVAARCRKLGLECHQGLDDKTGKLQDFARTQGVELGQIIYVGNDLNDLPCLRAAGLGVAVADAVPQVRAESGLLLTMRGGHGAVRELADIILAAPKK